MSEFTSRIKNKSLLSKVMRAEDTLQFFKNGMNIGFSGFAGNEPKVIPRFLADYVEENNLQGKLRFGVFTGASHGGNMDNVFASLDMVTVRYPYQSGASVRKSINRGRIRMIDKHLSHYAQDLTYHSAPPERGGKVDIAIVEVVGINEDGSLVLGGAVGVTPELVRFVDKIIIEVNTVMPCHEGMHDIITPQKLPNRQPLLITNPGDRIGVTYVECDTEKIVAVVESQIPEPGRNVDLEVIDDIPEIISEYILDFFYYEVKNGRLPKNLLPIQSGTGKIGNCVVRELGKGPFKNLSMWTEVIQDSALDLIDSGKLDVVSGAGFGLSADARKRFYENLSLYATKSVLRPAQISNNPELIRRLGVIAMNTPVECDIYGHVNSSLVLGSRMLNGIGGSGDFTRNSHLSIMHVPSVRPSKADKIGISSIVPKVSHVDHTEHDVDVIVTEYGLADLRGLCPNDRAKIIIDKCAHPDYKPILRDYYDRATKECINNESAHEPHILRECYKMYLNLVENGSMRKGC
ncbi:acetyl-CoA hydrolase [Geothermobacter ehrlichii]|uniref:Acetyl-CoA hydrolase n=1 Tax=Geothermobacter ehrlichii TaxID=213224 RepID=A0A5D3WLL0_9BACT|nr:acetyl-CoA hydrolase/transferase C-terminal domain-containing protein [Geothermobacter ehrlichii]TYO98419.1 acetyl-CoA hydrolase [Geothermobacter ehrlichii]